MKCDLVDIESFVAVVKYGGFTAAARATHQEKAQLSRRVARLEKTLGTPLLLRSTRRIGLTEAGDNFYRQANQGLKQLETAQHSVLQLLGEPAGVVRVAAPTFIAQTYLARLLQQFMEEHPYVQVHLEATLAGAGLGLLPDVIVDDLVAAGTLQPILNGWSTGPELLHLLHARPNLLLPAARRLIDFLVTELPGVIRNRPTQE